VPLRPEFSRSFTPDPSPGELEQLAACLRDDVVYLAQEIGERNAANHVALEAAARFIEQRLRAAGTIPRRQAYDVGGRTFANIEVELRGVAQPNEIVVLGAHYDSAPGSPGANDNASALACLMHLAGRLAGRRSARTLRLVAFANEEPPFTRTRGMGSRVYARRARREGADIRAMVCLETIGYRDTRKGSQRFSLGGLLLPNQGDFIALVSNWRYRRLLAPAAAAFSQRSAVDIHGLVLPAHMPGAWSSDHWSFWKEGFPAFMVTDTAPMRYPWYHTPDDTPEKVDYAFLGQVAAGIEGMLEDLLGIEA
jgi:Zn-dependent M28 family amino/carboxypeptidase